MTETNQSQLCSWCGSANDLTPARQLLPVWCVACGHRADVPKAVCDCPDCLPARLPIGAGDWPSDAGIAAHGQAFGVAG